MKRRSEQRVRLLQERMDRKDLSMATELTTQQATAARALLSRAAGAARKFLLRLHFVGEFHGVSTMCFLNLWRFEPFHIISGVFRMLQKFSRCFSVRFRVPPNARWAPQVTAQKKEKSFEIELGRRRREISEKDERYDQDTSTLRAEIHALRDNVSSQRDQISGISKDLAIFSKAPPRKWNSRLVLASGLSEYLFDA